MDPLKSGAIFRIKNVDVIRSPKFWMSSQQHQSTTRPNVSSSTAVSSQTRNSPQMDIAPQIRVQFDKIYRATPLPKSLINTGRGPYIATIPYEIVDSTRRKASKEVASVTEAQPSSSSPESTLAKLKSVGNQEEAQIPHSMANSVLSTARNAGEEEEYALNQNEECISEDYYTMESTSIATNIGAVASSSDEKADDLESKAAIGTLLSEPEERTRSVPRSVPLSKNSRSSLTATSVNKFKSGVVGTRTGPTSSPRVSSLPSPTYVSSSSSMSHSLRSASHNTVADAVTATAVVARAITSVGATLRNGARRDSRGARQTQSILGSLSSLSSSSPGPPAAAAVAMNRIGRSNGERAASAPREAANFPTGTTITSTKVATSSKSREAPARFMTAASSAATQGAIIGSGLREEDPIEAHNRTTSSSRIRQTKSVKRKRNGTTSSSDAVNFVTVTDTPATKLPPSTTCETNTDTITSKSGSSNTHTHIHHNGAGSSSLQYSSPKGSSQSALKKRRISPLMISSQSPATPSTPQHRLIPPTNNSNNNSKQFSPPSSSDDSSRQWSVEEVTALYSAHANVDSRAANFWQLVESNMRKRGHRWTHEECQRQWLLHTRQSRGGYKQKNDSKQSATKERKS